MKVQFQPKFFRGELCYDPTIDVEWDLYFGDPEEKVSGLAEELELCE